MTAPSFSAFYCTGGSACIYALVKTRCYERPHQNQGPVLCELYQHFINDSFRLWSHLEVKLRDAVDWWWPDENSSDHVGRLGYVRVTCSFFIYSGCVLRPVAVHQLHGHIIWWEGPLVKRLLPGGKQGKKGKIDSWFELLNSGSAVFNPTEVKTVFTHVCCVGSFHFRGLKFKWLSEIWCWMI